MIRIPVIAVACFAMFANDQAGALLALVTVGHRWGLILRQVVWRMRNRAGRIGLKISDL
jgi:hypothetical protein